MPRLGKTAYRKTGTSDPAGSPGRKDFFLKIAMAIENFSRHAGGAESYAVELARTLVSEGWEVHFYGYSWDGDPPEAVFHPIPRLPKWIPPSLHIMDFAFRHRRMVSQEAFDIILGFGNTITMNVYQSHGGVHYLSNMRKLNAVRNPISRFIKKVALFLTPKYHARAWIESAAFRSPAPPAIVAIADMVRDDMSDYFGVPKEPIRLVYNGIDESRFSMREDAEVLKLKKNLGFEHRILFLFMAYDFRKKGVRNLIEATAALRDKVGPEKFGVVIVGRTPSPTLRNLTEKLQLTDNIVFHGPTKQPELYYQACDVFVLPTFYDACSLVVFEAMAAGLPAITTVHNGASGIIRNGEDGMVLQDPNNIDEMCTAMSRFLDRNFLEYASGAAKATASRYTLRRNHEEMLAVFKEMARS
jgi:UDP-glucose:(heptosyl)LPS alpha-1,3-glucosyltransferase